MTTKEWYSPGEVYFDHQTALWIIQNLGILRAGRWPPESSNYIDILTKKLGRHLAYFEIPIQYAAEIELRMEKAGLDGLILLAIECWGETEASLANYLTIPDWSINRRKRRALAYVASGAAARWKDTKKRSGMTYREFKMTWGRRRVSRKAIY